MGFDYEEIKEIIDEYNTLLKNQELECSQQHIKLLESILKRHSNLILLKNEDELLDCKFLKELEKSEGRRGLALRIPNSICSYLHYKGISYNSLELTNQHALVFYNDSSCMEIRNFGKESHKFLGRYLSKKGLILERDINE